jgi:hypothetical protein
MKSCSGVAASNLDAALGLANAGLKIFPCQGAPANPAELKRPFPGFKWKELASRAPNTLERWWSTFGESAIAALPLGQSPDQQFLVIDCDRRPGAPDGVAAFAAMVPTDYDMKAVHGE